jgi:hypothetical protein
MIQAAEKPERTNFRSTLVRRCISFIGMGYRSYSPDSVVQDVNIVPIKKSSSCLHVRERFGDAISQDQTQQKDLNVSVSRSDSNSSQDFGFYVPLSDALYVRQSPKRLHAPRPTLVHNMIASRRVFFNNFPSTDSLTSSSTNSSDDLSSMIEVDKHAKRLHVTPPVSPGVISVTPDIE